MKNLKCLVVDDEPLAIDLVINFLGRLDISDITRCENGIEAFQHLQSEKFDLLFLDIEMPLLNGLDLLRHLAHRPAVVLTTAWRDYAVEGFDLEVLDYLVKPFSFARFLQTMDKFGRLGTGIDPQPAIETSSGESSIMLKSDRQLIRIDISDIQYIESRKDYIRVYTSHGDWLCHLSLAAITSQLPSDRFFRIHRSYTVALDKIQRFRDNSVLVAGRQISVSRENRLELRRRLHP